MDPTRSSLKAGGVTFFVLALLAFSTGWAPIGVLLLVAGVLAVRRGGRPMRDGPRQISELLLAAFVVLVLLWALGIGVWWYLTTYKGMG